MNDDELIEQMLQIFAKVAATGQTIPVEIVQGISRILTHRLEQGGQPNAPAPQIPAGADLLWILSNSDPDSFISYLHSVPDPELNRLARNPSQLQRVITQLSKQITVPHGEVAQGIPKADLQSSNVYGFSYNPRDKHLYVRFNSGSVYEYNGVPAQVFKIFASGAVPAKTTGQNQWGKWWKGKIPSLGAAFYNMIREGGFPYQKVA